MKKSMALCLAACAGALSAAAAADVELVAQWNDFSNLSSTNGSYTLATSGNTTVTDGVLNVVGASGGSANIDLSSANLNYTEGLTISFSVSDITNFHPGQGSALTSLFSFATTSNSVYTLVGYNSNTSYMQSAFNGSVNNVTQTAVADVSSLTSNTPQLVTVTFLSNTITMYLNGEVASTATIKASSDITSNLTSMAFGSWCYNTANGTMNENIYNLSIYRGAMSADQVRELVPEPATATLSLLALAGLAARRRRK